MAKKSKQEEISFAFFDYIRVFLKNDHKRVYKEFDPVTRKFLNFNNPAENAKAFLRLPQFEALETYVFLKEFCKNQKLYEIFEEWYEKKGHFEGRSVAGLRKSDKQTELFDATEVGTETTKATFLKVFNEIKNCKQTYPNYIFALTMGLGKTVLMATCIFYEFILARKYPKSDLYCHNALVFAPDKTVLQSLEEIQTFDKSKVVPPEYIERLDTNIKFHFLNDTGGSLNIIDGSNYNIIISNTQKIILKKKHKPQSALQQVFEGWETSKYVASSLSARLLQIGGDAGINDEKELNNELDVLANQRFRKILRLQNLGIYVDEAHHVFGTKLADDLSYDEKRTTSLRFTINEIAGKLKDAGSHVVACYNFTGTPYVKNRLLPEVVYSYGLKQAIDNRYLKRAEVQSFSNIREDTLTFVRAAINDFWSRHQGKRYENKLPKLAFFASTIDELQTQLRPAVEQVLIENNIDINKILVNVGDKTITTNDDEREFRQLDNPSSEKQFILLVNKGQEGWNCRSLFGVALHREPKSTVFVLQATMRCLRQITENQQTGMVYLSDECYNILNAELEENFRMTVEQFNDTKAPNLVEIRIVQPAVKIKFSRPRKMFTCREKQLKDKVNFEVDKINMEAFSITRTIRSIDNIESKGTRSDVSSLRTNRTFTAYDLIAETARYINISPIRVKKIYEDSVDGLYTILDKVNAANEILYSHIIPKLFGELFEIEEYIKNEEMTVELVKDPSELGKDHYTVSYKDGLLSSRTDVRFIPFLEKTFNIDNYCFDSKPEQALFWKLLNKKELKKVWFTGMLTHGQTDFYINYIDPESGGVRSYYPDFLTLDEDGNYTIIEVKGDNKIDDEVVQAKAAYARQLASVSGMKYMIIPSSTIMSDAHYLTTLEKVSGMRPIVVNNLTINEENHYHDGSVHDDHSTHISLK